MQAMYSRTLLLFCVTKKVSPTPCIRWVVAQKLYNQTRWTTTAYSGNGNGRTGVVLHRKLSLRTDRLGKLSVVCIPTLQSTTSEPLISRGNALASLDISSTATDKLSLDKPPSVEDALPIEEDGDIDILAEMEDPPVLERFASLPLPSHTYTLASYVEHSTTLQKLVELGVDLSKVEKRERIPSELLKMDFEGDIKDKLIYLNSIGVAGKGLGRFITRNPHILLEEVEELQARVDYLRSKKFSDAAIGQIVNRAPYFLSFSVIRVDRKLGYLQRLLHLKGAEVREVITKEPRLVTFKVSKIQENAFVLREQLGFRRLELKSLIVKEPKLLLRGKERLVSIFDYIHNVMEIPHKAILHWPRVFASSLHKIQERHQFLKSINRDVYDPTQPRYVPLERLSTVPDAVFCDEIAKRPLEEYNVFLKTL